MAATRLSPLSRLFLTLLVVSTTTAYPTLVSPSRTASPTTTQAHKSASPRTHLDIVPVVISHSSNSTSSNSRSNGTASQSKSSNSISHGTVSQNKPSKSTSSKKKLSNSKSSPSTKTGSAAPRLKQTTASHHSTITASPSILSTWTNDAGGIVGCTSLQTLYQTIDTTATSQVFCMGGPIIGTDSAKAAGWASDVSSWAPVSVPSSGCSTVYPHGDGGGLVGNDPYCTCAGTNGKGPSSVPMVYGWDVTTGTTGSLYTACSTQNALPTNVVQVPTIEIDPKASDQDRWSEPAFDPCSSGQDINANCWGILDLDDYVGWWWDNFKSKCGPDSFADCFMKLMTKTAPAQCSQANNPSLCTKPLWTDFEGKWNDVRNFYVAYTIFNVNAFLTNYWNGLVSAGSIATDRAGAIVSTIAPVATSNVALDGILTALSSGLALIPGPEGKLAKALFAAAGQAPGIAKYVFPEATTLQSQITQWQDVANNLGNVVNKLQNSISDSVGAILNDVGNFRAVATTGAFSGKLPPLQDISNQILVGLTTYMISQAYQESGIFISRQYDTSVNALVTNGTGLNWTPDCKGGYTNGICDTFWYDETSGTTYALTSGNPDNFTYNYGPEMENWFSQNYTTPQLLFQGSAACQGSQNSDPKLAVGKDGVSNTCLANIQVCTWSLDAKQSPDDAFSDCSTPPMKPLFQQGSCLSSQHLQAFNPGYYQVPRQYLGWGILNNGAYSNSGYQFCND